MQITEKDIFYYFKHPDQLEPDKKKYIDEHPNEFKTELDFLKTAESGNSESSEFQLPVRIELYKKIKTQKAFDNNFRLAAANHITGINDNIETFIDPGGNFIAKLITVDSQKRIYVFDNQGNTIKNITIRIKPDNTNYKIDPDSEYLELSADIIVEGFEIGKL